jgi:hypothetical protein
MSQETIYQCVTVSITNVENNKTDSYRSSVLVKIDADSGTVYIDNKAKSKYFIKNTVERKNVVSNTGDVYSVNVFETVDEEKKFSVLTVISYKAMNVTVISAKYTDVVITWYCYLVSEPERKKTYMI